MNSFSKLFVSLSLCLVVISGSGLSNCFSDNSFEELRKAAEQGDAEAQFNLALLYYSGKGVPKNLKMR